MCGGAVARWPEKIVQAPGAPYRVTVNLGSKKWKWALNALPVISQIIHQCVKVDGFLIGEDALEVDGIEFLSALPLTRSLVELIRDRRNLAYQPHAP